jgi:hypothetical protein
MQTHGADTYTHSAHAHVHAHTHTTHICAHGAKLYTQSVHTHTHICTHGAKLYTQSAHTHTHTHTCACAHMGTPLMDAYRWHRHMSIHTFHVDTNKRHTWLTHVHIVHMYAELHGHSNTWNIQIQTQCTHTYLHMMQKALKHPPSNPIHAVHTDTTHDTQHTHTWTDQTHNTRYTKL